MSAAAKIIIREGETSLDLNESDFKYFTKQIFERAGIYMAPSKIDLLKTRIRKRLQALHLTDYSQYRNLLESLPSNDPEWQSFVNILTTNKTEFFRESLHFDYLVEKVLPAWLLTGEKTLKVWSAACSTGEEVYTLAMVLAKHLPAGCDFTILGTDIDTNVLDKSKNAVYPMAKKHEIPDEYESFINIGVGAAEGWFRIAPEIKNKITFDQCNLMGDNLPAENNFDVVFCRNVLIYFNNGTVADVSRHLYRSTKQNGYCMIGHSESFQNIPHNWKMMAPSVYKKI